MLVIHRKPLSRAVDEDLLPAQGAPRHARDVVTDACVSWNLAHLIPPATLVISEFVSNVVDHAHTMMTIQVAVRDCCLYLAVHDGGSLPPTPRQQHENSSAGGRGLQLVAAVSTQWGYVANKHGKTGVGNAGPDRHRDGPAARPQSRLTATLTATLPSRW